MRRRSLLVVPFLAVLVLAGAVDDAFAQAKWKAAAHTGITIP